MVDKDGKPVPELIGECQHLMENREKKDSTKMGLVDLLEAFKNNPYDKKHHAGFINGLLKKTRDTQQKMNKLKMTSAAQGLNLPHLCDGACRSCYNC